MHISKARFSHHKILPISKSRRIICTEHLAELEWFCTFEKVQLCNFCLEQHQDHYVINKEQAKFSLSIDTEECRVKLLKGLEIIKNDKKKLLDNISTIERSQNQSQLELEKICERSIEEIKQFKVETTISIDDIYSSLKIYINQKLNSISIMEKQIEHIKNEEDPLEFLEKSYPFLKIKPSLEKLSLPSISYNDMQLPSLYFSMPSQNLYYLNRGTREFYIYSINNKELLIRELSEDSPNISRWSSFITISDGRILVTGGKAERNSGSHRNCMFIDPFTLQCVAAPPMNRGHSSHISLRILNKIYIISGKNEDNVCDSFCEVFDVYTEIWTPIGKINFPRTCASGAHTNKFIYVMGGFQNAVCNSIEKYSISANTWILLPIVLPEKVWQHGCFALDSKRILVFGGEKESEEPNKVSYIFNTENDSFISMTSIESIPVYLYFWIQVIRDGDYLYSINKEKTLVKYALAENKWMQVDLV